MAAGLGHNPSYIWRSLIWSREVVDHGLLWRVGDGKSIKNFEDNWIPSLTSKISAPNGSWNRDATVDSLIQNKSWDLDLINTHFNPYIAGEIVKIPLSNHYSRDIRFWRFDAKGQYSVRDGYRLQRGLFLQPENQSEHALQKWWSFIWSLSLPSKIRIFWWRVSLDIIPTNQNLLKHHVPVNESCAFCQHWNDSTCHSLFFCVAIRRQWKDTDFYPTIKRAEGTCTLDFCIWMCERLTRGEFERFAVQAWAIWTEKLNILHGKGKRLSDMNTTWSQSLLSDFQNVRLLDQMASKESTPTKKWMTSASCALKMNVDACINENLNRYSVGGVLRDNQGRLLLAFGKQISKPQSVVLGELEAIKEGIKILQDRHFRDVQMASDSLLAVQAVTTSRDDISYVGRCALEINELVSGSVISEFTHEHRLANKVAHSIAQFSSCSPSSFVWMNGEFPSWLVNLVTNDYPQ